MASDVVSVVPCRLALPWLPRTTVTVNGVVVTDYDGVSPVPEKAKAYEPDRGRRPDTGYIAVQHHGGKGVVTFKEITLLR